MDKTLIDLGCNSLQGYNKLINILGINDSWNKIFVEPNPEHQSKLKLEIDSIPNADFIEAAVTENGDSAQLITRADRHGDIAATLLGKSYLERMLAKFNQKSEKFNSYQVSGITLKSILDMVSGTEIFLKMDIEGAEYSVIDSTGDADLQKIKKIYIEFHAGGDPEAITNRLRKLGVEVHSWE